MLETLKWSFADAIILILYKSFSLCRCGISLPFFLLQLFHMTNSIVIYSLLVRTAAEYMLECFCIAVTIMIVFVLTAELIFWAHCVPNTYTNSSAHPLNTTYNICSMCCFLALSHHLIWREKVVIGNSKLDAVIYDQMYGRNFSFLLAIKLSTRMWAIPPCVFFSLLLSYPVHFIYIFFSFLLIIKFQLSFIIVQISSLHAKLTKLYTTIRMTKEKVKKAEENSISIWKLKINISQKVTTHIQ